MSSKTDQATADFLLRHVAILRDSYQHWTGQPLLQGRPAAEAAVEMLDNAPFAVVSHGTQAEPVFNYANQLALKLFAMDWAEFTALPSRQSAEVPNQAERARLLEAVTHHGYTDGYSGIRIAKDGRRFMIRDATIWNLQDETGRHYGQAALIRHWEPL